MMTQDFNKALDQCLTLLDEGSTLDECLTRYPEHAAELRSLLEVNLKIRRVPPPVSTSTAFTAGKHRMLEALAEKKRRQPSLRSRLLERLNSLFGERPWELPLPQKRPLAFQMALAAVAVLVIVAFGGIMLHKWQNMSIPQAASLQSVEGAVEVLLADGDTWRKASAKEQLEEGSRIRTGPLSAAELAFFDGSVTKLEAETEITLSRLRSRRDGSAKMIVLHQWLGKTHSQVQHLRDSASRFQIESATAVASVRGTTFAVTVDRDGTMHVNVEEGIVEVTSQGKTVELRAGQMAKVQAGRAPGPPEKEPTETPEPTETLEATETPEPIETSEPTETLEATETPQPSGLTRTPQPPGLTKTAQPPGLTKTAQPPGLTKTPQPPGQTKVTPGQDKKTPEPDDGDDGGDDNGDRGGGGGGGGGRGK